MYSPPYLFKGPRPTVTDAPAEIHYGQSFTVDTPDASRIPKVSLVRMGTVTHNFDMDQRFMNLSMTAGSGQISIGGPTNANMAPPGQYMVFLIDNNGVPSYGQIVKVNAAADTQAPTAPASLTATAQASRANLELAGLLRQRRRERVPRLPVDDVGLHARRLEPDRDREVRHDVRRPGARERHLLLPRRGGRQGRQPRAPPRRRRRRSITGDTTAPTVAVSAPAAGASLDRHGFGHRHRERQRRRPDVQFKLDGQDLGTADTASPYTRLVGHQDRHRRPAHAHRRRA